MTAFTEGLLEHIRNVKRASITIDLGQRAVLIANLRFLYDAVVASEQLLTEAAAATELLPRSPFYDSLAQYYRSHLEEERGHLALLHADLVSAGATPGFPDRLAMALIGTQYYLLKHVDPAALLGYIIVVEGDPVPTDAVDLLEKVHGKNLFSFTRFHASKDLEHRKELFAIIDQAPAALHDLITYSSGNALDYFAQAAKTWSEAA